MCGTQISCEDFPVPGDWINLSETSNFSILESVSFCDCYKYNLRLPSFTFVRLGTNIAT